MMSKGSGNHRASGNATWEAHKSLAATARAQQPEEAVGNRVRRLHVSLLRQEEGGLGALAEGLTLFTAAVTTPLLAEQCLNDVALTPQMREAWELAYPNQSLGSLANATPAQVAGFVNGWKGKYFEVLMRDELNAGHWVGDLHLDPGQTAHLAPNLAQPGWDIAITDGHGDVVQDLQLKATNSLGYLKVALERYPDVQILTTDEVLDPDGRVTAGFAESLIRSGVSNDDLTEQVTVATDAVMADATLLDDVLDFLPGLPFVVIALGEGRQVLLRGKTLSAALESGMERATASGAAIAVGGALALLDCGVLSLPAALVVRTGVKRQFRIRRCVKRLNQALVRLSSVSLSSQPAGHGE